MEQDWNRQQLERPVFAAAFRVWCPGRPAIVLGCSQRALRAGVALRLPDGLALLERESGGGAVLSGPWMVSVSVVLPADHAWMARGGLDAYRRLGQVHAMALAGLGIETLAVQPGGVAQANQRLGGGVPWACFGRLAPWELTDLAGRKLVGLAQRRQRNGVLLVAGTLCHQPDWRLLCDTLGVPRDAPQLCAVTATCDDLAQRRFGTCTLATHLRLALADELSTPMPAPHLR